LTPGLVCRGCGLLALSGAVFPESRCRRFRWLRCFFGCRRLQPWNDCVTWPAAWVARRYIIGTPGRFRSQSAGIRAEIVGGTLELYVAGPPGPTFQASILQVALLCRPPPVRREGRRAAVYARRSGSSVACAAIVRSGGRVGPLCRFVWGSVGWTSVEAMRGMSVFCCFSGRQPGVLPVSTLVSWRVWSIGCARFTRCFWCSVAWSPRRPWSDPADFGRVFVADWPTADDGSVSASRA